MLALSLPAGAENLAEYESAPFGSYGLDSITRATKPTGPLRCPTEGLIKYSGNDVSYHKAIRVHRDFSELLARMESHAAKAAEEIYGRKPTRIRHLGTYNCRRIRRLPHILSEHALGNAIDIAGFDFGRAAAGSKVAHRALSRPFQVRVDKHWDKKKGVSKYHAAFLRSFTKRVLDDRLFRVVLGPSYPGHKDHFHFDQAPYTWIEL